jgi:anthranilate phosphoribosyltransferase
MTKFSGLLEKLARRDDLTTDEAAGAMAVIMRGEATPAQIAGSWASRGRCVPRP